MKKILFVMILAITACTTKVDKFSVPETNLTIDMPETWKLQNNEQILNAKKNVNNSKEISQELKDDLKSLDEVNTYIFLKPNKAKGKDRNYNASIIVKNLVEEVDIDLVAIAQLNEMSKSGLQGTFELDKCPNLNLSKYRCIKSELIFDGSNITQYQYLTLSNNKFVMFNFSIFEELNPKEVIKVISSISTKQS